MSVTSISGASGARPVVTATTGAVPDAPTLPPADAPSPGAMQDALTALYAMMAQLRDAQMDRSKNDVAAAKMARDVAERERREALDRAREAAEDGGFFDWICEDVGIAGVAGLVTLQWHVVAADVAAHETGLVRELGLDFADEAVRPIADDALRASLLVTSVAGTVLTCGTTTGICLALAGVALSAAGGEVARTGALDGTFGKGASHWIGLGMQVCGAATSASAGFAAGGPTILGPGAARAASIGKGAVDVMNGADGITLSAGRYRSDVAGADAEAAKRQAARLQRWIAMLVDGVRETRDAQRKTAEALESAIRIADQTSLVAVQTNKV